MATRTIPKHWVNRLDGTITADELIIGRGVVVEAGVEIEARRVVLGDYCFIGRGAKIRVPEFRLGDYSKLHAGGFVYGPQPVQIGRNCWIGGGVVLDGQGGLVLDDGVGVGSGSQLWTHIRFGDVVEGCRFNSTKFMHVGKDAWFVGHCLVSPVAVGERSMALLGSVVTRDMRPNHVYGGAPAVDLTDKLGPQFEERTVVQKADALDELIIAFERKHPEHAGRLYATYSRTVPGPDVTHFNVSTRTYTQTHSAAEVAFLKAHVPLIKFTPWGAPPFVDARPPVEVEP